jgi:hypothetical protein
MPPAETPPPSRAAGPCAPAVVPRHYDGRSPSLQAGDTNSLLETGFSPCGTPSPTMPILASRRIAAAMESLLWPRSLRSVSGHDLGRATTSPMQEGLQPPREAVARSTTTVEAPAFRPGIPIPLLETGFSPGASCQDASETSLATDPFLVLHSSEPASRHDKSTTFPSRRLQTPGNPP